MSDDLCKACGDSIDDAQEYCEECKPAPAQALLGCYRCQKLVDSLLVPFWAGICWPCYNPDERQEIRERILFGYSITDKASYRSIEDFEKQEEGGSRSLPSDGPIDFFTGFAHRFIGRRKDGRGRGNWKRK